MGTNDLFFIILRHINTVDDAILWKSCYDSIRKFYPDTMIVIIDNDSNLSITDMVAPDINSCIHSSELPKGRLFVPYYYFLTHYNMYKKAIILHDSTILQGILPVDSVHGVKYLWHFETHEHDNKNTGLILLKNLKNTGALSSFYTENRWHGCLGCMCIIEKSFLQMLEDKYSILSLKNVITTKLFACEYERIFSVLCTYECPELFTSASLFGDISTIEWGLSYDTFIKNREKYTKHLVVKLFAAR